MFQIRIKEEGNSTFHLAAELPLEIKINLGKTPVKPQEKN
jgi:hypothetical protein